jgi:hypothetical protein
MAAQQSDQRTTTETGQAGGVDDHAPPDPQGRAQELLSEAQTLLDGALEKLQKVHDPAAASILLGQASDRVGSTIFFLRQVLRRR